MTVFTPTNKSSTPTWSGTSKSSTPTWTGSTKRSGSTIYAGTTIGMFPLIYTYSTTVYGQPDWTPTNKSS